MLLALIELDRVVLLLKCTEVQLVFAAILVTCNGKCERDYRV